MSILIFTFSLILYKNTLFFYSAHPKWQNNQPFDSGQHMVEEEVIKHTHVYNLTIKNNINSSWIMNYYKLDIKSLKYSFASYGLFLVNNLLIMVYIQLYQDIEILTSLVRVHGTVLGKIIDLLVIYNVNEHGHVYSSFQMCSRINYLLAAIYHWDNELRTFELVNMKAIDWNVFQNIHNKFEPICTLHGVSPVIVYIGVKIAITSSIMVYGYCLCTNVATSSSWWPSCEFIHTNAWPRLHK